jgi:hypothetical protein
MIRYNQLGWVADGTVALLLFKCACAAVVALWLRQGGRLYDTEGYSCIFILFMHCVGFLSGLAR